jgi:hypothetical protein
MAHAVIENGEKDDAQELRGRLLLNDQFPDEGWDLAWRREVVKASVRAVISPLLRHGTSAATFHVI